MDALLLAAGLGSRLGSISQYIPKPLLPVNGAPLLAYLIQNLADFGVDRVFVNVHHKPEWFDWFVEVFDSPIPILLMHEEQLLGSNRSIQRVLEISSSDKMVIAHADNYVRVPLQEMKKLLASDQYRRKAVGLVFRANHPENCGIFSVKADRIYGFEQKPMFPKGNIANGAVFLFDSRFLRSLLHLLEKGGDFCSVVLPLIYKNVIPLMVDELTDVGTIGSYSSLIAGNGKSQNQLSNAEILKFIETEIESWDRLQFSRKNLDLYEKN